MITKPVIGITMGDAAGIGPEIIAKALMDESIYADCQPIVIGDAKDNKAGSFSSWIHK